MAMYRIIDGGTFFDLDAVLQGDVTLSGRITEKPLSDGSSAADHYVNAPKAITFSGVITDVKSYYNSGVLRVQDWIKLLSDLKEAGRPFTIQAADGSGMFFEDCLFESVVFSNDQRHGRIDGSTAGGGSGDTGEDVYSYNVSFTVKQLKRSRRGKLVAEHSIDFTQPSPTKGSGVTDTPSAPKSQKALDEANRLAAESIRRSQQSVSFE